MQLQHSKPCKTYCSFQRLFHGCRRWCTAGSSLVWRECMPPFCRGRFVSAPAKHEYQFRTWFRRLPGDKQQWKNAKTFAHRRKWGWSYRGQHFPFHCWNAGHEIWKPRKFNGRQLSCRSNPWRACKSQRSWWQTRKCGPLGKLDYEPTAEWVRCHEGMFRVVVRFLLTFFFPLDFAQRLPSSVPVHVKGMYPVGCALSLSGLEAIVVFVFV